MQHLKTGRISYRAACVCALIAPGLALAAPGSRAWIPDLTAKADAIVVGTVQGTAAAGVITATIHVERVLKGQLGQGVAIVATCANELFVDPYTMPADHGIFFLQRAANGPWALLPAARGAMMWWDSYIRTPAGAAGHPPANSSPLANVLAEIASAIEAGGARG